MQERTMPFAAEPLLPKLFTLMLGTSEFLFIFSLLLKSISETYISDQLETTIIFELERKKSLGECFNLSLLRRCQCCFKRVRNC